MNKFPAFLLAAFVFAVAACTGNGNASKSETSGQTYASYCNSTYNFCVDYPEGLLYPQPESDNGDGRSFKDKNGNKVLIVYRTVPMDETGETLTLDQQFEIDLRGMNNPAGNEGRTITYNRLGKNFYVISGFNQGKIFYQKTVLIKAGLAYAYMEYPEAEKEVYGPVAKKIFTSFK
ncbi:MAG: hypothetical protein V4616_01375 [Bacteroidota bacterium]